MDIKTLWGMRQREGHAEIANSLNCSGDAAKGGACDWLDIMAPCGNMTQKKCMEGHKILKKVFGDNQVRVEGLNFPIAAGAVDININIDVGGLMKESETRFSSVSQSGERVFCVKVFTGKADKRGVRPLTYKDCGDSQTHGRIVGLFPSFLNHGASTRVTVKAIIDREVKSSSGKYHIEGHTSKTASIASWDTLADCSGAAGEKVPCHLRLGLYPGTPSLPLGTIKSDGMKFPVWEGSGHSFNLELSLNPLIPSFLAVTYTRIRASTKSGEEFFCFEAQTNLGEWKQPTIGQSAVLV